MAEQTVLIAARMYNARATLRRLWGDDYATRIAPTVALIRDLSKRTGKSPVLVVIEAAALAKREGDETTIDVLIAGLVEMMEPT